jgi:hypothetical protein
VIVATSGGTTVLGIYFADGEERLILNPNISTLPERLEVDLTATTWIGYLVFVS